MKKILILFAHPALHKSRVNSEMIKAISPLDFVKIHNLYEEYPDFHIKVKREQSLLLEHDIYIWHHPFYWYSAPAILKEWIDLVLEHNFAFGHKGTALKGKTVMNAITTGGSQDIYFKEGNENIMKQFLSPFQRTAEQCRMLYLPPFVVHGTHLLDRKGIVNAALKYQEIIISLRDELYELDEMCNLNYLNDLVQK